MSPSDHPLPPSEPDIRADPAIADPPDYLVDAEIEGVRIEGADLSGRDARGLSVTDSILIDVDLSDGVLSRARLLDVVVHDAGWANVQADEADLRRVRLERVRMTGGVLAGGRLEDVTFVGCRLDLCNLRFVTLERVRFEDCRLHDADLQGVRCASVVFQDCDLTEASWSSATFEGSELRSCDLTGSTGLESLHGIGMPWDDVVRSMHEIAQAAGIRVID